MEAEISEAIADAAKDENALKVCTPVLGSLPPPQIRFGFESGKLMKGKFSVLFP
jgi:hypothetical protein